MLAILVLILIVKMFLDQKKEDTQVNDLNEFDQF